MKTNTIKLDEAKLTKLVKEAVHDAIAGIAEDSEESKGQEHVNMFWQVEPHIEKLLKSMFPLRSELKDPEHPEGPFMDQHCKGEWIIWSADKQENVSIDMRAGW